MFLGVELAPLVGEIGLSSLAMLILVICHDCLGRLLSFGLVKWDVFAN